MRYQDPQLCELLAAEYVLGTLKGRARRRFEGLLHARPDLRRRVREWESRFHHFMAASAPAVPPPPEVWAGIERRLFGTDSPTQPAPPRWFERLAFWRNLALGSSLLAGALAIMLLITPRPEAPGYVAVINDPAQRLVWMISTSADMERLYVRNLIPMDMPANKRCVLWLRPKASQEVYALGMLPDQGDDRLLPIDRDRRAMLPGQLLVTIEEVKDDAMPRQPTSPPVYQGEWMPIKA